MTITEAELGQRAADEPAPAEDAADDLFAEAPPEHAWPGTAFVWMLYAGGALSLLWTVALLADATDVFTWRQVLGLIPMSLFPGVLMVWIARMIQQFKLTGWGVALVLLFALLLSNLRVLGGAEDVWTVALSMVGAGVSTLWICYLWIRRSDFS